MLPQGGDDAVNSATDRTGRQTAVLSPVVVEGTGAEEDLLADVTLVDDVVDAATGASCREMFGISE